MSTRTTLILLVDLIVVAGAVYLVEFRKPAGGAAAPAPSSETTTLLNVTVPSITGISVRDVISGTAVSATRDISGTWWLGQPANKPADPAALNTMATQLSSIFVQRTLTPTVGLSEYGLVTPTITVQVNTTGGQQSFSVGDQTPSKSAYYVQKPGDTHVYLVDSSTVDSLRDFASKPPVAQPPTPASSPLTLPPTASP